MCNYPNFVDTLIKYRCEKNITSYYLKFKKWKHFLYRELLFFFADGNEKTFVVFEILWSSKFEKRGGWTKSDQAKKKGKDRKKEIEGERERESNDEPDQTW